MNYKTIEGYFIFIHERVRATCKKLVSLPFSHLVVLRSPVLVTKPCRVILSLPLSRLHTSLAEEITYNGYLVEDFFFCLSDRLSPCSNKPPCKVGGSGSLLGLMVGAFRERTV